MHLDSTYLEFTDATERYIRSLLSADKVMKLSEIKRRHDIANGTLAVWFEMTSPLVDAEAHKSEQDRLGELVHELASAMPAAE